jgi:hypothetical protein
VAKLRAQPSFVARGSWIVCSLLMASALLAGCNQTGTASTQAAQAAATTPSSGAQSPSGTAPSGSGGTVSTSQKSADVSWTPPTTNTNGSALTDLAGYRIYYGTSPSQLTYSIQVANAGAYDYVVQGLTAGTWYFAVSAYTNTGLQSALSAVASKTIS